MLRQPIRSAQALRLSKQRDITRKKARVDRIGLGLSALTYCFLHLMNRYAEDNTSAAPETINITLDLRRMLLYSWRITLASEPSEPILAGPGKLKKEIT